MNIWRKLWADFFDEFSISIKKDEVKLLLLTKPVRFLVYVVIVGAAIWGLRSCDSGVPFTGPYNVP